MPVSESIIQNEQTILRNELQELKKCQLQYFLLSIGATGAIFGFNKELLDEIQNESVLYLAPLIIILPCWLTFFDKAYTITRLTGYIRVFIEERLKNENEEYSYIGYETALSVFRKNEKKFIKKLKDDGELDGASLRQIFNLKRNLYWKINWVTFFLLSACCLFTFLKDKNCLDQLHNCTPIVFIIIFIVVICAFYTFLMVWRLMFGVASYENVKKIWNKVFDAHFNP